MMLLKDNLTVIWNQLWSQVFWIENLCFLLVGWISEK